MTKTNRMMELAKVAKYLQSMVADDITIQISRRENCDLEAVYYGPYAAVGINVLISKKVDGDIWGKVTGAAYKKNGVFSIAAMPDGNNVDYVYLLTQKEMGKLIKLKGPKVYEKLISGKYRAEDFFHYSIPYFSLKNVLEGDNLPKEYEPYMDFVTTIDNVGVLSH